MKYKEITIKPEAEVKQLLTELRLKAHDLSVKIKLNQLKNSKELGAVKKDIARIMFLLHKKAVK
jgi:ribosomal protein L29